MLNVFLAGSNPISHTGRKDKNKCYDDRDEIEKVIEFNVEKNKSVYLKIVNTCKREMKCSWVRAGCIGILPGFA